MLSKSEIDAIRERCEKATNGPWSSRVLTYGIVSSEGEDFVINSEECEEIARTDDWENDNSEQDATFIANARQDIPKLLSHIAQQEAEVERLKRKLALIEDKADRTMDDGVDLVAVELLYEIYLHAKEDEG